MQQQPSEDLRQAQLLNYRRLPVRAPWQHEREGLARGRLRHTGHRMAGPPTILALQTATGENFGVAPLPEGNGASRLDTQGG